MPTTRVTVTTQGKFFTGAARADLRRELDDIKKEVADDGLRLVEQRLGERLKQQNTKYGVNYMSQLRVEKLGKFNDQLIHDGGVVYGPWLESGKYSPPRRFKGYRAFRRARTQLRKQWMPIAQRRIDALIARWNT